MAICVFSSFNSSPKVFGEILALVATNNTSMVLSSPATAATTSTCRAGISMACPTAAEAVD